MPSILWDELVGNTAITNSLCMTADLFILQFNSFNLAKVVKNELDNCFLFIERIIKQEKENETETEKQRESD